MNRRSAFIQLSLAFALLMGLYSCSKDYPPYLYETREMVLYNNDISSGVPHYDEDSVPKNKFSIQMNLRMVITDRTGADFGESDILNEDQVTEFVISSPQVFNGVAPNESLNDFFRYSPEPGKIVTITSNIYTEIFSYANRMQNGDADAWNVNKNLHLNTPPDLPGNYIFVVSASFNDGRNLTDTIEVQLY